MPYADDIALRPAGEADFPAIMAVQGEYYSGHFLEPEATLRARRLASPDTAWVAVDAAGICAYLFGYRSVLGKVTSIRGTFEIAEHPDTLYLHDLAVSKRVAGRGVGLRLVRLAWQLASSEGLKYSSLISLAPARAFWEKLGYRELPLTDPYHQSRLSGYCEPVSHMAISLGA